MVREHWNYGEIVHFEQFFPHYFQHYSYVEICIFLCAVKLLSDQLRDHQKAVAEEKGSPNATKVHHTKQSDSIYYTLATYYFQQNHMLLVLI